MSDIPERTRKLIRAREDDRCAVCRRPMTDIHHRQRKGMGGSNAPDIHDPVNLVGLCRADHGWVHANPAAATLCGLMVPTTVHPAQVPVWMQNVNYGFPAWFQLFNTDAAIRWVTDEQEPVRLPPRMPALRSVA